MNLIKAIQKYYDAWGIHYETKNIFITNGGSEALEMAVFSLCDPGDEILVFEPIMLTIHPLPNWPAPK